ncbi:hypothetical protein HaLaN_02010 [Haematococcus lacustris]|uniref:Uncharacterized protein n=1 Tax=Haematococcus lacustris TaxID=44745 RepID=A0A699YK13_HAELA|nr:hypothetical protein HaLaN_02010 [Haematococcus lacustris]
MAEAVRADLTSTPRLSFQCMTGARLVQGSDYFCFTACLGLSLFLIGLFLLLPLLLLFVVRLVATPAAATPLALAAGCLVAAALQCPLSCKTLYVLLPPQLQPPAPQAALPLAPLRLVLLGAGATTPQLQVSASPTSSSPQELHLTLCSPLTLACHTCKNKAVRPSSGRWPKAHGTVCLPSLHAHVWHCLALPAALSKPDTS